jgi:hypothetical protein
MMHVLRLQPRRCPKHCFGDVHGETLPRTVALFARPHTENRQNRRLYCHSRDLTNLCHSKKPIPSLPMNLCGAVYRNQGCCHCHCYYCLALTAVVCQWYQGHSSSFPLRDVHHHRHRSLMTPNRSLNRRTRPAHVADSDRRVQSGHLNDSQRRPGFLLCQWVQPVPTYLHSTR